VIQAPVGSASCPALAAAVSNAGGLGMLALSWRKVDAIQRLIRETKALTSRPFGVNLVLEWPQEARLRACLEEGVGIVSFFWGEPNSLWQIAHDAGALVLHQIGSLDEARRSRDAGTDVIVAQGFEAGGHVRGTTTASVLLHEVVAVAGDVPVIAAGGIADAADAANARAAGAAGVWVGTRFVASEESAAHPYYKQRIVEAASAEARYTLAFDGGWANAPHRALRNSTMEMWERTGSRPPGDPEVVARFSNGEPVYRFDDTPPVAGMTGDMEALALYAGESAGRVIAVEPAAKIVRELGAAFV
jgi:NAD(P)H-dependent flavin oxidoreductase YrpB (nitropropane dioxygenase family)